MHVHDFSRTYKVAAAQQIKVKSLSQVCVVLCIITTNLYDGRMDQIDQVIVLMGFHVLMRTQVDDVIHTIIFIGKNSFRTFFSVKNSYW